MREALERAQKLARQEKLKARTKHVTEIKGEIDSKRKTSNINSEVIEDPPLSQPNNEIYLSESKNSKSQSSTSTSDKTDFKKSNQETITTSQPSSENKSNLALVTTDAISLTADSLAVVLGTASSPDGSLSNITSHDILPNPRNAVQLALLMPQTATITGSQIVVENKLVIPTRYRHHARATQTDSEMCGSARMGRSKAKHDISNKRRERKKSASLDRPQGGCKLPLRCRSLSQPSQPRLSIEDRPKWGVNRPPMQYIKQSERDPYYQRRLRQRLLRAAMLAGSNGSRSHAGSFGSGGGGETGTESDTCTQRRVQRPRNGSSEENSRSPSPQQNSFSSRQKPLFYRQQSQKYLDRTATEKSDVSVISLDLCAFDSLENNAIIDGRRKNSIQKNQIRNIGSPNERAQILSSSLNIPHRFGDSLSRRKTSDILSVSSPSFTKTSNGYTQRLLHRKSQPQVSLEIKSNGNLDQWTSQDILSQLTTLRQGLLIKQQEWETRRNQAPF